MLSALLISYVGKVARKASLQSRASGQVYPSDVDGDSGEGNYGNGQGEDDNDAVEDEYGEKEHEDTGYRLSLSRRDIASYGIL